MITFIGSPATASARWRDFSEELNCWGAEGRMATLWWRDDDAAAPCRQLDDLLSAAAGVPVALAVIPALAGSALAGWLEACAPTPIHVLQHGWRHLNHRASGKKSEFPSSRVRDLAAADLWNGRQRLMELFGARALAVLAPPWNNFDAGLLPLLVETGLAAISVINPRRAVYPIPGVFASNVHVDLVAWRADRSFIGAAAALGEITAHLQERRLRSVDADEPTGILTHHLVHDDAARAFLAELVGRTREHPAARWLDAVEVFGPAGTALIGAE
jgi:hypothetical protein